MSWNGAEAQQEAEESPHKLRPGEEGQWLSKRLLWVPAVTHHRERSRLSITTHCSSQPCHHTLS